MTDTTTWNPEPEKLPWNPPSRSLVCPGCPDHGLGSEADRYELVMEGYGLGGAKDDHDAVRVTRRAPGLGSGPFDIPPLPAGMPAVAVIDYLERQTFDAHEVHELVATLAARFPDAVIHVWAIGADITRRIAEDAYWDAPERVLVRAPVVDIAPHEYEMDVGWRLDPERVEGPDGDEIELWRGCLYVDPEHPGLVRNDWDGLGAPGDPQTVASTRAGGHVDAR